MPSPLTNHPVGLPVPGLVLHRFKLEEVLVVQCGIVSRQQVRSCGMTDRQLGWCLKSGRWRRLHVGVYAAFNGPLTFEARVWAAVLRAGRGAAASHQTAAYLDGVCDDIGPVIHVTVPAGLHVRGRIDGVQIHYAHRLVRTRHPTRLPPRTRLDETVLDLVDAASSASEVETWVTRACQRRRTTPERLAEALGLRKKIRW